MSFWENNCKILAKQYHGLLNEITKKDSDAFAPQDMQTETAASGEPSLRINGIHIHSQRDPYREARRLAQSIDEGNSPIVILGFGLGYAAQAAAELHPKRPIIIVEKYPGLLAKAFELRDMTKLLLRDNIVFAAGGSGEGVTKALSLFEENPDTPVKTAPANDAPFVMRSQALVNMDEQWYGIAENRIRTWAMKEDVNKATLKMFGKRWIRNLSRNMDAIRDIPGVSCFTGIAAPKETEALTSHLPVFFAAGGPSLDCFAKGSSTELTQYPALQGGIVDLTIPLLKDIHKRAIIVAVDTSLRFFVKNGVHPDFVVVVDPQFWNSRHLDACTCACAGKTRLVAESAVYPPVLRLPFKERYLCGSLFPLGRFIENRVDPKGQLGAGGSVATTAWDFARSLGTNQIWIAGLDLAYPSLKTHFRGALFEARSHAESRRLKPAETWLVCALRNGRPFYAPSSLGTQVLTDQRLSLYAAWFENRFRQFPKICNYSLFPGGLAISGLQQANIESFLALPDCRSEINERLQSVSSKIQADFFSAEEIQAREKAYKNARCALLRGLEQIKTASQKGAAIAEKALKYRCSPDEQNRTLKNLDEIYKSIVNSEAKEAAGFLFPPNGSPDCTENGNDTDSPFAAYLKSSARLFNSLAAAVDDNLRELS